MEYSAPLFKRKKIMTKFLNESGFRRIIKTIKDALAGKQDKKLVVTVTGVGGDNITADKTYNEILSAYNNGADILVDDGYGYFYHLIAFDSGWFIFMMKPHDEENADYYLLVSPQNVWTSRTWVAQEKLTSGTNIKTINNTSLLGSGNISIEPNEIASITTTESTASGGNNTVTINTTDGTSKTFNVKNGTDGKDGQDGADGVSLGEIALVQTTGDSEESVMSQKAVTEYGRKVTAEDLDGTSEWIRTKLTEEGWEFGKYINSSGTTNNNTDAVATPYIPINGIENHEISLYANLNLGWAAMCFYDENKTKLTYILFGAYTQITQRLSSYSSDIAYVRTACLQSDISKLNIVDNDTGEVLFDGKEKLLSLCEDRNIPCDTFQDKLLSQELGSSSGVAVSQNVVNNVQRNVDAIGRRSYGITSVWNANKNGWISRSEKQYDVSSEPWVDVVSYNVSSGTSGNGMQFFGFCPTITSTPNTANDYIGFVDATWDVNFIVRRNGTTVHTTLKAISSFSSQQVLGFRLDFRRKTILIMWRTRSNGTLGSTIIDLSSYDINLGKCYLYSTMGHCSYVANTYVGWNSPTNMTDFSAFFGSITVGNFANITELAYPDADIDGSDCGTIGNLMSNYSATQDTNKHWVATIDKSSFTDVNTGTPSKVVKSSYLYSNWDCLFYVGKIKASGGALQFKKSSTGGTIKDVFDITSGNFITGVDGVYTIQDGHTVEVRAQCQRNGKNKPFMFLGTCTVEMWDWVGNVSLNSNLTPMNYDGSKIFGGISFLHNRPELVVNYPLITTSNYFAQGFMKYSSNKLYARVYDTSSNTYVDKQISNT